MKKTYIAPDYEVLSLEEDCIICGSADITGSTGQTYEDGGDLGSLFNL